MRLRRVLTGAAVAVAAAAGIAAAAPAAGADSPNPWQPYRSAPFTVPAGLVCPFAVHGDIVSDEEQVRNLQTYPDGSPKEQEFVGLLVIRFTNTSTGASVERNLTGTGYWTYGLDGSTSGHGLGHMGLGVHIGNPTTPPGEYVLTGDFEFVLQANGTRTFTLQGGTAENLCQTLG